MNRSTATDAPTVTFQEVDEDQTGQRLDNFLLARLKGVPKSRIYRIIRKGEVRVNKKRVKPEYKLQAGDRVRIPPVRLPESRDPVVPSAGLQRLLENAVLYQNDALVVINKPAGLPVHGGTGVKIGLIEALRAMYPDLTGLELVHRLDKGTSGCLLLAKNARVLKQLSAQFKKGAVSKTYHAIVEGRWPAGIHEIDENLKRQEAQGGERRVTVSREGKSARTLFAILQAFDQATLVEAKPVTGRTHQIRVHAMHAGHPVIGDEKYASEASQKRFAQMGIRRLCLHAVSLALDDPASGTRITVEAPYDERFREALTVLRTPAADSPPR